MTVNRCAIYVRKSTEHGLDMEFNSLQNQEESCKAYIASQTFNGWQYYKTYSDAAISGGTMERPALKQMLNDMAHGLVNTVVVYKVDRLSRSILDFHNMMKYFEKYNANFVSITQSFDTSNSMGKLTLNMLLSFAQFEREVASERVRDKIRASKAKGIWVGGNPRLGYDIINKKLIVNPTEAEQVKTLFEKYIELQSVVELVRFARVQKIHNKQWLTKKCVVRGGAEFYQQTMHNLLRDEVYIGNMVCKSGETSVPGEHEAIIDKDLFNRVQMALARNGNNKGNRYTGSPNLLTGKLFDIDGIKFTNQQTRKPGQPVKYYYAKSGFYIPSLSIDEIAMNTISEFLNSSMRDIPPDTALLLKRIDMQNISYNQKRDFIKKIITKVVYSENKLTFYLVLNNELKRFISESFINENADNMTYIINKDAVIIERPFILSKYNKCNEYNCGKSGAISISDNNHLIVRAFARAFKYRELYEKNSDYKSIARAENVSESSVYRHLKLAYMNPHTINDIMSGKLQCSVDKLFNLPNML